MIKLYVVYYQSVTRNSNNSSLQQRAHNPAYTNKPLPRQIQILNLTVGFYSQPHVCDGVIKTILVSIICITFNLDA